MIKIVLGEKNDKTKYFSIINDAILTDELCGIKFIKEEVELFIPYSIVLDNGMISNTSLFIEELLITLNVKKVYLAQTNNDYLEKISVFYKVEFYTDYSV